MIKRIFWHIIFPYMSLQKMWTKKNFKNRKEEYSLPSSYIHLTRSDVLMPVIMCSTIFCVVMPCSLVEMYCLHLQVWRVSSANKKQLTVCLLSLHDICSSKMWVNMSYPKWQTLFFYPSQVFNSHNTELNFQQHLIPNKLNKSLNLGKINQK